MTKFLLESVKKKIKIKNIEFQPFFFGPKDDCTNNDNNSNFFFLFINQWSQKFNFHSVSLHFFFNQTISSPSYFSLKQSLFSFIFSFLFLPTYCLSFFCVEHTLRKRRKSKQLRKKWGKSNSTKAVQPGGFLGLPLGPGEPMVSVSDEWGWVTRPNIIYNLQFFLLIRIQEPFSRHMTSVIENFSTSHSLILISC